MTAHGAFLAGIRDRAGAVQPQGVPRGVFDDHRGGTAPVHIEAVAGPQQQQPRRRLPIVGAVAVAGLPAVNRHQEQVFPIRRKPEDRPRMNPVNPTPSAESLPDVHPVHQNRIIAADRGPDVVDADGRPVGRNDLGQVIGRNQQRRRVTECRRRHQKAPADQQSLGGHGRAVGQIILTRIEEAGVDRGLQLIGPQKLAHRVSGGLPKVQHMIRDRRRGQQPDIRVPKIDSQGLNDRQILEIPTRRGIGRG